MARIYGPLHTLGGFIGRCLPRRGGGAESIKHFHDVIAGLIRLDKCQRNNRAVTLSVSAGGGIGINHNGLRLFMIEPGQAALSTISDEWLTEKFAPHLESGAVEQRLGTDRYTSWKVKAGHLDLIWEIVEGLSQPEPFDAAIEASHPRSFPGPARQAALEAFEAGGNVCPGYGRSRHRVDLRAGERIEFDHILPYAAGGTSSDWNIQVLCQDCNRAKRATAG